MQTCTRLIVFGLAIWIGSGTVGSAQERCAAARDMVASARSTLKPGAGKDALQDAVERMRRATELCPGLGDAYYFLSLLGQELKDARADGWRAKAVLHDSDAMKRGELVVAVADAPIASTGAPAHPAAPTPVSRVSPYVRRKLALVIGVGKFRDPEINTLRFTGADATEFAQMLRGHAAFDEVKTLIDEEATTYQIKTEIDAIAKVAMPEDLVVLFVATHGSPQNLDAAGVNYIVTYDTKVNNLYATALPMGELTDAIIGRIGAERVVAFLDTCYSGGTFNKLPSDWVANSRALSGQQGLAAGNLQERLTSGARSVVIESPPNGAGNRLSQGVGRVIITASRQEERSWEQAKIGHGYFTYFLLEALRRPGAVSIEDVYGEVRVKVADAVLRDQQQPQHPTIARSRDRVELYLRDAAPAAPRK